jgi:hypothetical protein
MNHWHWQTVAACIVAGVFVMSASLATLYYEIKLAASGTGWSLLEIPAGVLLSAFVLPCILIGVTFMHARRQEIVDRFYRDGPNP